MEKTMATIIKFVGPEARRTLVEVPDAAPTKKKAAPAEKKVAAKKKGKK
tara:strand:+ start:2030 stop:2176 length:147 start_codon:yes stop_codon:yes gene_type:complete